MSEYTLHPGEYLRHELKVRGWSQVEFAEIIGRPVGMVNAIINGRRGITVRTAKEFEAALGASAETWIRVQIAYELHGVRK